MAAIVLENLRLNEKQLQRKDNTLQRQAALIELGKTLTSQIDVSEQDILNVIYQSVSSLMKTNTMYIALYDKQTRNVRFGLVYENGKPVDIQNTQKWQTREVNQGGRTEWIIREKKPLLLKTRQEFEKWYKEPGRRPHSGTTIEPSWLGVPMVVSGNVIGVIAVHHDTEEYAYNQTDQDFLLSIANQAAIALSNAQLYHRLNALIEIAQRITSGIDQNESEVLDSIYHQAYNRLQMKNFSVALYDESTDVVKFVLASRYGEKIGSGSNPLMGILDK